MRATRILRRICHDRLDQLRDAGLEVPVPFDGPELCRRIGQHVGREVRLTTVPMPTGHSGLTFLLRDTYVVAVESRTSQIHRDHILAHEIGHLIFGHEPMDVADDEVAGTLFPSVSPALVRLVLARTATAGYTEDEEKEAEVMATILLEGAKGNNPDGGGYSGLSDEEAAMRARLRRSLEHPDL
jgi:hypothetical protein